MKADVIKERNKVIKDLEKIFALAIENQDYKAAIQAKQIVAKMQGFLDKNEGEKKQISLIELSQEDLEKLITEANAMQG